ncbi:polyamine ABC transporter substrate-binding protein [Amaricoccus sp.]|uniref:polyamine ABC transporter substrate-binding protein n=1 Tax=Amaricoccus sp. TaxID=1872485 RepID=UPI001B6D3B02|nr:polyamine ABC transporter substrate-binding protein [Amaricoccus sp.]MBP7000825.1 polyamine ABC transporter substrate-binding protein [Amaricoccus sp.]
MSVKALMFAAAALALSTAAAVAQDKVVNVYNWSDYIAEDTIEKFEAETGIKVVYDVFDSNETLEAKLVTGNSGYDVVVPTSGHLRRQIEADLYLPLDKSKLPNLANMDPDLMKAAEAYDPGNEHAVIYMWLTTGIGYNAAMVRERLGDDAPTNSWSLIFDPQYASKLADCGISILDSPTDVLPSAMAYLGIDPTSTKTEDLEAAAALLEKVRPYIRQFHSSQYINDLANGSLCVALGFSGDIFIAADRAAEAGTGIEIKYSIPKEGALLSFDMLAIPADAPHPEEALAWINFIMKPEITADITNYVYYANANIPAMQFVNPEIAEDPAIFPPAEVKAKLFPAVTYEPRTDRAITRLWTTLKTGQ